MLTLTRDYAAQARVASGINILLGIWLLVSPLGILLPGHRDAGNLEQCVSRSANSDIRRYSPCLVARHRGTKLGQPDSRALDHRIPVGIRVLCQRRRREG